MTHDAPSEPSRTPFSSASLRSMSLAAWAFLCLGLAACGGGSQSSSPPSPAPAPMAGPSLGDANVMAVYVDGGPSGGSIPNAIYADVKICPPAGAPGPCAVVDHVLVDTGSVGLRVMANALPAGLLAAMPASTLGPNKVGQCLAFAVGVTWGSVREADLRVGGSAFNGKIASSIPIQVIADPDPSVANVPASCASQGSMQQNPAALGANGILGVGLFKQDCGEACANFAYSVYYSCSPGGSCSPATMPLPKQVANPVSLFSSDNNGSSLILPAPPGGMAPRLDGLLVFGIGTSPNNALPSGSQILGANSQGLFSASFNGNTLPNSFIDSGSSINFFPPLGSMPFPSCAPPYTSFFCPASSVSINASNTGRGSTFANASVYTVNAANAFAAGPSANAFLGLSGNGGFPYDSLDLGASFFLGRSVATLIESSSAPGFGIQGPAFAYTP